MTQVSNSRLGWVTDSIGQIIQKGQEKIPQLFRNIWDSQILQSVRRAFRTSWIPTIGLAVAAAIILTTVIFSRSHGKKVTQEEEKNPEKKEDSSKLNNTSSSKTISSEEERKLEELDKKTNEYEYYFNFCKKMEEQSKQNSLEILESEDKQFSKFKEELNEHREAYESATTAYASLPGYKKLLTLFDLLKELRFRYVRKLNEVTLKEYGTSFWANVSTVLKNEGSDEAQKLYNNAQTHFKKYDATIASGSQPYEDLKTEIKYYKVKIEEKAKEEKRLDNFDKASEKFNEKFFKRIKADISKNDEFGFNSALGLLNQIESHLKSLDNNLRNEAKTYENIEKQYTTLKSTYDSEYRQYNITTLDNLSQEKYGETYWTDLDNKLKKGTASVGAREAEVHLNLYKKFQITTKDSAVMKDLERSLTKYRRACDLKKNKENEKLELKTKEEEPQKKKELEEIKLKAKEGEEEKKKLLDECIEKTKELDITSKEFLAETFQNEFTQALGKDISSAKDVLKRAEDHLKKYTISEDLKIYEVHDSLKITIKTLKEEGLKKLDGAVKEYNKLSKDDSSLIDKLSEALEVELSYKEWDPDYANRNGYKELTTFLTNIHDKLWQSIKRQKKKDNLAFIKKFSEKTMEGTKEEQKTYIDTKINKYGPHCDNLIKLRVILAKKGDTKEVLLEKVQHYICTGKDTA